MVSTSLLELEAASTRDPEWMSAWRHWPIYTVTNEPALNKLVARGYIFKDCPEGGGWKEDREAEISARIYG